jgi:hypothetical protein
MSFRRVASARPPPCDVARSLYPEIGGAGGPAGGSDSVALSLDAPGSARIAAGGMPNEFYTSFSRGGWNGGGAGGPGGTSEVGGGGGGGASDVRRAPYHLSDRLLIAGGGGGGGPGFDGGAGGGIDGASGVGECSMSLAGQLEYGTPGPLNSAGGGATQSAGGSGSRCDIVGNPGVAGNGGSGVAFDPAPGDTGGGGGGGGGLYGGAGGTGASGNSDGAYTIAGGQYGIPDLSALSGGGGGGSGFGPRGAVLRSGRQAGSGVVKISYAPNCSAGSPCVQPASAPTRVIAAPGDRSARVSFAVPSQGTPILHYRVTAFPGGAHASSATSPITVKGLKNGSGYRFRVTATNLVGTSPVSAPSTVVTPSTVLAAPTDVIAIPGNAQALVDFTPPSHRHARSVFYTVTASPGGETVRGRVSPFTITGLTNGTTYTFTVTATNDIGPSAPSQPSNAVTPFSAPGSPTAVIAVAGDGEATVGFHAAPANGAPISKYTVTATSGRARDGHRQPDRGHGSDRRDAIHVYRDRDQLGWHRFAVAGVEPRDPGRPA